MKALLIDLDDTLFDELSYVYSGYRKISKYISSRIGLDKNSVYNRMIYHFTKYGRVGVFDDVMEHFEIDSLDIDGLVNLYRYHDPEISFTHGTDEALKKLRNNFRLAVITDGHVDVQRQKVQALKLDSKIDEIVYCMSYDAPKPSLEPYFDTFKRLGINREDSIIIGDDPYCDMKAAALLEIPSYRILSGKHMSVKSLNDAMPEREFVSFSMAANFLLGEYV